MAVAADPSFWRRFSLAVHQDEQHKAAAEDTEASLKKTEWLYRQRQKKRQTFICGFVIAFLISFFIAAVVVVLWWFGSHDWLRNNGNKG